MRKVLPLYGRARRPIFIEVRTGDPWSQLDGVVRDAWCSTDLAGLSPMSNEIVGVLTEDPRSQLDGLLANLVGIIVRDT